MEAEGGRLVEEVHPEEEVRGTGTGFYSVLCPESTQFRLVCLLVLRSLIYQKQD